MATSYSLDHQKSNMGIEKDKLCGNKEMLEVDNKESNTNTQVIGSALQVRFLANYFLFYEEEYLKIYI